MPAMKTLAGKTALVTGSASGIGRALALELARQHVDLFLVDLDHERLAEAADEVRQHHPQVTAHVADLTRTEDIQGIVDRLLKRWNGVDILVNNAGVAFHGSTHNMTDEHWDRVMAVNMTAPILLTRKLLPAMLGRNEAHILNVCSIAGLVAAPRTAAYHASKFGLVGFSESLRAEYGPRGLGVTALCPGFVRTEIFRSTVVVSQRKPAPTPPRFLTTTPERVARRAVRAILRGEGVVVITPFANAMWRFKRFAPGLFDRLQQFRRFKRKTGPIQYIPAPVTNSEPSSPSIQEPSTKYPGGEARHILPFPASGEQRRHAA
jgi:short-subunit dehydrogenase